MQFPRDRAVRLALRAYRSRASLAVEMDLGTGRYAVEGRPEAGPIGGLAAFLAQEGQAARTPVAARSPYDPPPARRPYRAMVLILMGALVAIAGATFVTLRLEADRPPQTLDRVPPPPRLGPQ